LASKNVAENGYCAVGMIDPKLRPALIETLKNAGIGFGTIYPGAMSLQAGSKGHLEGSIDYGNAHYISQAVLNLPAFAYITDDELKYVCDKVKKHF
jgi:dTDP-4-amino-4,6-dideoxygalactose transaminase